MIILSIVVGLFILITSLFDILYVYLRHRSQIAICSKNQSQILTACITYDQRELGDWWPSFPYPDDANQPPKVSAKNPHEARLISVRIMAALSLSADYLSNSTFTCPAKSQMGPKTKYNPTTMTPESWGATRGSSAAYAIDWAVPFDETPPRILIADRSTDNHNGSIVVCYSDSSVKTLNGFDSPLFTETMSRVRTEPNDGEPRPSTTMGWKDDIYSPNTHNGYPQMTQGGGDQDHVWVK